jgi:hypothetical protein
MATIQQQLADLETRVQQLLDGQAVMQGALAKIGPSNDAASLDAIHALAQSIADAIGIGPSNSGNTTVPPAPVAPPTPAPVIVPPAPSETSGSSVVAFPNLNPTPASPL